jgi:hypothetical protein
MILETGANLLPVPKYCSFPPATATRNTEADGYAARNVPKSRKPPMFLEACRIQMRMSEVYSALMFDKNSPLVFVLLNLSISNSIASTGESGFSTFRSTQIRDRSSRGISNSSLRVPER